METRYVMLWDGGLYHSNNTNVFTLEGIREQFVEMLGKEIDSTTTFNHAEYLDDDPITTDFDGLVDAMIEAGSFGRPYFIFGTELAELGGDFVQASLVSLEE
jgi:hypothetical protein